MGNLDLTGKIFDNWEVLRYENHPTSNAKVRFWRVKCVNCGYEKLICTADLTRSKYGKCNCNKGKRTPYKYKEGDLIGNFRLVKPCRYSESKKTKWWVECSSCGYTFMSRTEKLGEIKCPADIHKIEKGVGKYKIPLLRRLINASTDVKLERYTNMIGQKYGKLLVTKILSARNSEGRIMLTALCDCGCIHTTSAAAVLAGKIKSCGCWKIDNLVGHKIERLTVLWLGEPTPNGRRRYVCQCECGNTSLVMAAALKRKTVKSCGCIGLEKLRDTIKKFSGVNHPAYNPKMSDEDRVLKRNTSEYRKWKASVLQRDNYTCMFCNSTEDLHVHHFLPYSSVKEYRTEEVNGITLCAVCHRAFHSKYKTNYGITEMIEFLSGGVHANIFL